MDIFSGDDEEGIDEIRHGEARFADHTAEPGADSQAAGTNLQHFSVHFVFLRVLKFYYKYIIY